MKITQLWQETDRQAQELFGDGDGSKMSPTELDIIFSGMSHKEKVEGMRIEANLCRMWADYKAK